MMFVIRVYFDDVLRYTVTGDWDKIIDLRSRGYAVYASPIGQQDVNRNDPHNKGYLYGNA